MMMGLGHRHLERKELGVYGPRQVHSAGVRPQRSRRALVSHGSLDEAFKCFVQGYLKEEGRGLMGLGCWL